MNSTCIFDNLNLDGEVIIIWDGINGVMVNIDQTEVDRLSTLEQVKSIEEDIHGTMSCTILSFPRKIYIRKN
jgi:hypothetical protein